MSGVKVKGVEKIIKQLTRAEGEWRAAITLALYAEGLEIIRKSVRKVPVDTGRLRASWYIIPPSSTPGKDTVQLGYNTKYAEHVHEFHRTKSKYLESAIDETSQGRAQRVKDRAARYATKGRPATQLAALKQAIAALKAQHVAQVTKIADNKSVAKRKKRKAKKK